MMTMLRICLASLLALAAVGCGETPDDPDQLVPIGHVRGTISNPANVAVAGSLRTAIVWYSITEDRQTTFAVAQGIAVSPTLPAGFALTLTEAPPAEAIAVLEVTRPRTKSLRGALGRVVAYEDRNGNGQLDIVTQGDPAYVDRIVGQVGGEENFNAVMWLEPQDVAQAEAFFREVVNGYRPRAGYNLIIDNQGDGIDEHWASIDTPLEMVLSESPEAQLLMCVGARHEDAAAQPAPLPGEPIPEGPGPDGVWPDRNDPLLACGHVEPEPGSEGPGDPMFTFTKCTVSTTVCMTRHECVTTRWRKPSDPAKAAGWPCDN